MPAPAPRYPRQMRRRSAAATRLCLRALLLSSRASASCLLHCQPEIEERCVVIRRTDAGAVEPLVPGVLQPDARVEPRPSRRGAADEWNVGDLADPAVTVRTEAAGKSAVQNGIGGAPGVEVLAGQHDP